MIHPFGGVRVEVGLAVMEVFHSKAFGGGGDISKDLRVPEVLWVGWVKFCFGLLALYTIQSRVWLDIRRAAAKPPVSWSLVLIMRPGVLSLSKNSRTLANAVSYARTS